jgi:hypothetical protein
VSTLLRRTTVVDHKKHGASTRQMSGHLSAIDFGSNAAARRQCLRLSAVVIDVRERGLEDIGPEDTFDGGRTDNARESRRPPWCGEGFAHKAEWDRIRLRRAKPLLDAASW